VTKINTASPGVQGLVGLSRQLASSMFRVSALSGWAWLSSWSTHRAPVERQRL